MIIAIYQPHQNLRQHDLVIQNGYKNCFQDADKVYWLPTFLSREDASLAILTPAQLIKFVLPEQREKIEVADLNPELATKLKSHHQNGDQLIFMGAGNIDSWARECFADLKV